VPLAVPRGTELFLAVQEVLVLAVMGLMEVMVLACLQVEAAAEELDMEEAETEGSLEAEAERAEQILQIIRMPAVEEQE